MKKIKFICSLLLAGSLMTACTKNYDTFNTNDGAYTPDKQLMDNAAKIMYFNTIQRSIYFNDPSIGLNWTFQIAQNLNSDMYGGYFHDMNPPFSNQNSSYALNNGWNSADWNYTYQAGVTAINKSIAANENISHYKAVTLIYKVAMMHRLTDKYGPLFYNDFIDFIPDSMEEIYKSMFNDLTEALSLIDLALKSGIPDNIVAPFDILMQNSKTLSQYAKWANSLRLRLAMRVSNVDKSLAETNVKAALASSYGIITNNSENIEVTADGNNYVNPIATIHAWWEVYMNASFESFMVGFQDPRLPKFFTPAAGGSDGARYDYTDMFVGIPQGFNDPQDATKMYQMHSRTTITEQTINPVLMSAAEVWFLRAEAALRGLTSENAQNCYETGVRMSFQQHNVDGVEAYLQNINTPSDYKDAFKAERDMKAMTAITPKWMGGSQEQQLEQIITQKWIAMYPEGGEAWAEQRRTGYPKLFKVLNNLSQGTIDTEAMIRRLPYSADFQSEQPNLYKMLVDLLGGQDNGGTRLWWDTNGNKF